MLEQLDKVDGVHSAMANHSGTLLRVSPTDPEAAETIAAEVTSIFEKQNRKAKRLDGDELISAINKEQWRTAGAVSELSEIEFRTVFARRVKLFTEDNDLGEETNAKLIAFSEEVLKNTAKSDENTDFKEFCSSLASRMLERSKELLTEEQLEELAQKLKARVLG